MIDIINQSATRISLIRHGQVNNPDDIFYGRLPGFKLDKTGQQEAERTAEALKKCKIDCVYSSPMLRARQTANKILTFHPQLKLKTSSLITEVFSGFQGRPSEMLAPYSWDVYADKNPRFEQPGVVSQRTEKFLRRIRKKHAGRHVAVVTHGDVILFSVFKAKKIPITAKNKLILNKLGIIDKYPATGSITTLTFKTKNIDETPKVSYLDPSLD